MDNQAFLENLAQLQNSLQDIDSARKMVTNTVQAYNDVLTGIGSYSEQLSIVAQKIDLLIDTVKQNREALSSNTDAQMDIVLNKAEQVSASFAQRSAASLTAFEVSAKELIGKLQTSESEIAQKAQLSISQANNNINKQIENICSKTEGVSEAFEQKALKAVSSFENETQSFISKLNTSLNEAQGLLSQANNTANDLYVKSISALKTATEQIESATDNACTKMDKLYSVLESNISKKINAGIVSIIIPIIILIVLVLIR